MFKNIFKSSNTECKFGGNICHVMKNTWAVYKCKWGITGFACGKLGGKSLQIHV